MIYIENQIKLILVIQHPTAVNTLGKAKCKALTTHSCRFVFAFAIIS
jgi:hypothetical protein